MKEIFFSLLVFMVTINMFGQSMDEIINNVKMKFAPDKRTTIFNIKVENADGKNFLRGETNLLNAKDELMNELSKNNFQVVDEVSLLPEKELGEKIFGVVNLSVANLRSEPNHPAELSTQALLGTVVNIYKKKGGWYLIQTPDNYLGWVDDDAIFLMNQKELSDFLSHEKIIVTVPFDVVYANDKRSSVVSDVVIGNILTVNNIGKEEYSVQLPDGRSGYISSSSAKTLSSWNATLKYNSNGILSTAKAFMGIPYLWGGTSCKGFDCSGFTKTVFFMNGFILPRDASQQVFSGVEIDTKENFNLLKEGDLLFFGEKATENKKERITHVGIYIGDTEFIHAAGMVKINSLDKSRANFSEYRFRTFVRAKRILNVEKNNFELVKDSQKYFWKENQ